MRQKQNNLQAVRRLLLALKSFLFYILGLELLIFLTLSDTIAQDAKVVFSENFDNATTTQPWAPYFSSGWFCKDPLNTLQTESGKGKVLKVNFPANTVAGDHGFGNYKISLDSSYRELYLSWDYFLPSNFDYGWSDNKGGGKFFGGFSGGSMTAIPNDDATDVDGWASILMFQDGYYSTYNYFKGVNDYTSDGWPNGARIANIGKGQWRRITIRLKINDGDLSNGLFEVFDNDVLAYQKTNAQIVNAFHPEYLIEHIYLNSFFGGSGDDYVSEIDQYMEFDNLIAFYYPKGSSGYRAGASETGRVLEIPEASSYHPIPPNKFTPANYTDANGIISSHCAFYQPVNHTDSYETSTIQVTGATYLELDVTRFDFDPYAGAGAAQSLKIYQGIGSNKVLKLTYQNGILTTPGSIVISGNLATIEWLAGKGANGGFGIIYTSDGTSSGNNFDCGDYVAKQYGIVTAVPGAPSALTLTSLGSNTASFKWTDNSYNESWFEIERTGPNSTNLVQKFKCNPNITTYTDASLQVNSVYTYRIRAYNSTSGYSSYSNTIEIKTPVPIPVAPSSLILRSLSNNTATFQWTDNSNNESWFEIERHGPNNINLVQTFKSNANTTTYSDAGLQTNSIYSYKVRAYNSISGYSSYSNSVEINTIVRPNAPSKLQSKEFTNESITIRWNDNSTNEEGFIITRSLAADNTNTTAIQVNPNDTIYTDSGLESSRTYVYTVRAVNDAGTSAYSNVSVASTLSLAETRRVKDGLIAYYNFVYDPSNIIRDLSGYGEPLDLKILQPSSVLWEAQSKLEVVSNTTIASTIPAKKIVNAIKNTGEITLECWIKPSEPSFPNSSRVISMAIDDSEIGFVLDQYYNDLEGNKTINYSVRMQTESTNESGYPEIIQNNKVEFINLQHVTYVRDSLGKETLFVNGNKTAEGFRPSNLGTWNNNFYLRLGNEKDQNHAWEGILYSVAIFNRALNVDEVIHNYSVGPCDSIPNDGLDFLINVYPNPIADKATIEITPIETKDITPLTVVRILDINGKTHFKEVIFNPNLQYSRLLDFKNYTKGIYFLQIISGKKQKAIKLIIP